MSGMEREYYDANDFDDQIDIKLYLRYILENKKKVFIFIFLGFL